VPSFDEKSMPPLPARTTAKQPIKSLLVQNTAIESAVPWSQIVNVGRPNQYHHHQKPQLKHTSNNMSSCSEITVMAATIKLMQAQINTMMETIKLLPTLMQSIQQLQTQLLNNTSTPIPRASVPRQNATHVATNTLDAFVRRTQNPEEMETPKQPSNKRRPSKTQVPSPTDNLNRINDEGIDEAELENKHNDPPNVSQSNILKTILGQTKSQQAAASKINAKAANLTNKKQKNYA